MFKILQLTLVLIACPNAFSQEFSGRIIDSESKEGIPFASIYITNIQSGVTADSVGVFSFNMSLPDNLDLKITAPLYETLLISLNKAKNLQIELHEKHVDFDDVVVSGPAGGTSRSNAYRIEKLKLNELGAIQASSLSEALSNITGVQQASFGAGISKPVIRGMQGVRVLTLINGMRIENQQWGGDHGMAVNQLGISSVEVIKGPSSLLFGADAFGGVLYLVDDPYTKQNSFDIDFESRFNSVSAASYNTVGLKMSKGAFRFNVHGLYSDNADYQLPNGEYAFNTRFNERGIKTSLGLSKKNWVSHLRYTYSQNRTGLPGHMHHEDEEEEEHDELHVDEQNRGGLSPAISGKNHMMSFENKWFLKKNELSLLLGMTNNQLNEFEEDFNESALNMNLTNSIYNVKYKHVINSKWKLVTGLQGMYQVNKNAPMAEEQLIPNFEQSDNGVYAIGFYEKGYWNIQFGGRFDVRLLSAIGAGYEEVFNSPNFSAGFVRSDEKQTVRLNLSSGFRAPHLSELLSDGEHEGAIRYEVGNSEMVSEKSIQADLSYELHREHFEWVINPFYNYIENYIYLEDQDSILNELPVYQYAQASQANLYGVDLGVHYHPHFAHWLHLESSYSYVRGEDLQGRSFSLIPQARLNTFIKVKFEGNKKFKVNEIAVQHQYYFAQNKVDNFETQSTDYHLINLGMDMIWKMKNPLVIGVGVKNVLNEAYINHLSRLKNIGLESPGRNFYISLKYKISGKI